MEKVFVHEIGHLLGLEHPWDKPDGDWAVENSKVKTIHTIMGYDQEDPTGKVMDWFQKIDKLALRKIWGPNNRDIVDNYFFVKATNINLYVAITGNSKKSEKVEGTDGDDLIADGPGKDKLIGGDGADQFYFAGEEPFKKKTVDKVIDFDASEGDAILIDEATARRHDQPA